MNIRQIELLIDKYFEGQSSLEEEKAIREYLQQQDIPDKFKWLRDYFLYTEASAERVSVSEEFDKKLIGRLKDNTKHEQSSSRKLYMYVVSGVAASILLVIGLFSLIDRITERIDPSSREAEVAYQQASQALLFVSAKINSGMHEASDMKKLNENISKMEKISMYNKGLEEFKEMSKIYETPRELFTK